MMDGMRVYRCASTDELMERDHELRASLCGIEAVASALSEQRDRLSCDDVDQLILTIASEARRLRLMLAPRAEPCTAFDLAEAIRPAMLMARSSGVVVRDAVPSGIWVDGRRDDVAQVVLGLLTNARLHAPSSPVELRVTSGGGITTLYVEDRGPGITGIGEQAMFNRGRRGPQSSGSGLGLSIARRLMVEQAGSLTAKQRRGGGTSVALSLPTASSNTSDPSTWVDRHPAVA